MVHYVAKYSSVGLRRHRSNFWTSLGPACRSGSPFLRWIRSLPFRISVPKANHGLDRWCVGSWRSRRSQKDLADSPAGCREFLRLGGGIFFQHRLLARNRLPGKEELRSEEHTSELQSHSDLVCRL